MDDWTEEELDQILGNSFEDLRPESVEDFCQQQQKYVEGLCGEITDGTCKWIYRTHEYRDWIRKKQCVLCINGSPWSGKSCLLASMLANRLGLAPELHTNSLIMKLFYDYSMDPSFSQVLQALLLEALGESARSYFPVNQEGQVDIGDEDLEEVLVRVLIDIGQTKPVFLLIDDITKLDNKMDGSLLPFLGRLLDNASSADILVHVCYSKRDYPPLKLPRSIMAIQHQIRIDAYNQPDIRLHVEKEVVEICSRLGRKFESSITDQIVEMAGTGFTATNSYLERLEDPYPTLIEGHLMSEYISLMQVHFRWREILRDVLALNRSRDTRAVAMIQCVLAARRPLSLGEFCSLFDITSRMEVQEVESLLISESLGLLCTSINNSDNGEPERQQRFVSFIQPSLRQHLESPEFGYFLIEKLNQTQTEFIAGGHSFFWRKGIESLKAFLHEYCDKWKKVLPEFVEAKLSLVPERNPFFDCSPIFDAHPLLEYTLNNLFVHAVQMIGTDEERSLLAEFHEEGYGVVIANGASWEGNERYTLLRAWCHLNNCLQGFRIYGPSVTLVHVLAKFNMSEYLSWGLEQGWTYQVKTRSNQTALHWAAFYGSEQAAKVLLECSLDDEITFFLENKIRKKDSYFVWLTYVGYREHDYRRGALHIAAAKGNVSIVTLLLSFNTGLREKLREELPKELEKVGKNDGETIRNTLAIFDSAWDRHLNAIAWDVPTVLEHAVEGHHATVVETLLEHGADWRLHSGPQSPLQLAMRLAQDEITLRPTTKAIVRMLKAAAFAVLDNASTLEYAAISDDKLFEGTKIEIIGTDVTRSQIAIPTLLSRGETYQNDLNLTWYHLPANNMKWAEILILRLLGSHNRDRILRHELWTERQIRGSERSYISFMRPGCEKLDNGGSVLFMPYIHWETQQKQRRLETVILCKFLLDVDPNRLPSLVHQLSAENNDLLNAYADNASADPKIDALSQEFRLFLKAVDDSKENKKAAQYRLIRAMRDYKHEACISDRDMRLIDFYANKLDNKHSLHIRRTLDQSFYHTLDTTSTRNKDQVVTRYGRREKRKQPVVMMVDQLWLWCIGNIVITCFPQRRECGLDDPDRYDMTDVLENILHDIRAGSLKQEGMKASDLLLQRIINECAGACFDPMKNLEDDFKFLDMFSNSISRIADGEVASYERFVKMLKISGQQDLMDIDTESSLLREIKDILDELRMVKLVLIDQLKVMDILMDRQPGNAGWVTTRDPVSLYLERVEFMQKEGERTVNSLNALMDLRQRHATLWEAKSTGRQGNTIMVFTVVTILFLPASFMASFFALPVLQFSRADSDNMDLSYVVKWIIIFTLPVAVFFVSLAFYINDLLNAFSRITGHEQRVAKRVAEAERRQIGQGFISGLDDWKDQDDVKTEYKKAREDSQDDAEQREGRPVVRLRKWLRNPNGKTDSLA